ncbi:MAG TPA: hypothetical protein VNK96_04535 [Fimbriimonadales bacterium]|nr:hypothetical protein [Fimbriimonadales bacterium]
MLNVFLAILFLAVVFSVLFVFLKRRKSKHQPPLVRSEYWIYTSAENLPSDKELMERLLARNPHRKGGVPIGAKEGLTFSDIRFHIGFAKREQNAMMFRPEILCETDAEIPSDIASVLEKTNAAIRVTFISEDTPIKDTSYLQFVTHCVDALAEITNAPLIYDVEAQKFWKREDLYNELQRNSRGDRFDLHVVIHWVETTDAGWAFTRGMAKVGLPDIEFGPVPLDHKTIALYLVEGAARECWKKPNLETMTVEGFGESFRIEFGEAIPNSKTHRSWVASMRAVRKIKMT